MARIAADHEPQAAPLNPFPITSAQCSRRGALRAALLMVAGAVAPWLALSPRATGARRNACHVRCGADRRLCRNACRDEGASERQCKRTCTILRDSCVGRCEFRPLRSRLVRDYPGRNR